MIVTFQSSALGGLDGRTRKVLRLAEQILLTCSEILRRLTMLARTTRTVDVQSDNYGESTCAGLNSLLQISGYEAAVKS